MFKSLFLKDRVFVVLTVMSVNGRGIYLCKSLKDLSAVRKRNHSKNKVSLALDVLGSGRDTDTC